MPEPSSWPEAEILVRFEAPDKGVGSFGVGMLGAAGERTVLEVHLTQELVCVDGTQQGNPEVRCGPYVPAAQDVGEATVTDVHVIVDSSIIEVHSSRVFCWADLGMCAEVIVNNSTALTVSVTPSAGAGAMWLYAEGNTTAQGSVWEMRALGAPGVAGV